MRKSFWAGIVVSSALTVGRLQAETFTEQKVTAQGPSYSFGSIVSTDGGTAVSWRSTNRFSGSSQTMLMERGARGWGISAVTNASATGVPFVVNGDEIIYQDVRALNVYRRAGGEWKKVQTLGVTSNAKDYF